MIPIYQTQFGLGKGNCLVACVASILGVDINTLPNFCVDIDWFNHLYDFCEKNGFSLTYWKYGVDILIFNTYLIGIVELEGTEELHAVVGKTRIYNKKVLGDSTKYEWEFVIEHDPNINNNKSIKNFIGFISISKQ